MLITQLVKVLLISLAIESFEPLYQSRPLAEEASEYHLLMVPQTATLGLLGELLDFLLNLRDSEAELVLVIALQDFYLRFQALILLFKRCKL